MAIAASAKSKITYQLGRDGSVVLRSIKGITLKALKRMSDADLKAIGLFRTLIGADEKFFPLDPNAIASSPKPKSTKRLAKAKQKPKYTRDQLNMIKNTDIRKIYRAEIPVEERLLHPNYAGKVEMIDEILAAKILI